MSILDITNTMVLLTPQNKIFQTKKNNNSVYGKLTKQQ